MILRLAAGLAVFALAGCASASTVAGSRTSGGSNTCPPANAAPPTAASPSQQPPGTHPAVWSPAAPSPAPISSPGSPVPTPQSVVFSDDCTGKVAEGIFVSVTITSMPTSSGADRHYDIAHVTIQNGGLPLPYGPGDFRFVASNGQTYVAVNAPMSLTPIPAMPIRGVPVSRCENRSVTRCAAARM